MPSTRKIGSKNLNTTIVDKNQQGYNPSRFRLRGRARGGVKSRLREGFSLDFTGSRKLLILLEFSLL
jgi:hypothetical protein